MEPSSFVSECGRNSPRPYPHGITPVLFYENSKRRTSPGLYARAKAKSFAAKYGETTDFAFVNKFALIVFGGLKSHRSSACVV